MEIIEARPTVSKPEIEPHDVTIRLSADDIMMLYKISRHPAFGPTNPHSCEGATDLLNRFAEGVTDAIADISPQ